MTTPVSPSAPTPPPAPFTRNGLGTTALVLGIVGFILAWIPIIGFFGFILGALAIIFGAIGVYRTYKGTANNRVMAYFGLGLGVVAFVLSIVVFGGFMNAMSKAPSTPGYTPSGGAGGAGPGAGPTSTVVYEVTSTGSEPVTVTYTGNGTSMAQDHVSAPWHKSVQVARTFGSPSAYLTASGGSVTGSSSTTLHCKTMVDGKVVAENENSGSMVTVDCHR